MCQSKVRFLPTAKRTTQALSVFPIPVPGGSALMWIKGSIITVGKDRHLPTVPGFFTPLKFCGIFSVSNRVEWVACAAFLEPRSTNFGSTYAVTLKSFVRLVITYKT